MQFASLNALHKRILIDYQGELLTRCDSYHEIVNKSIIINFKVSV